MKYPFCLSVIDVTKGCYQKIKNRLKELLFILPKKIRPLLKQICLHFWVKCCHHFIRIIVYIGWSNGICINRLWENYEYRKSENMVNDNFPICYDAFTAFISQDDYCSISKPQLVVTYSHLELFCRFCWEWVSKKFSMWNSWNNSIFRAFLYIVLFRYGSKRLRWFLVTRIYFLFCN